MGYWQKNFADGSMIRGSDKDVSKGLISWSRSKFQGMSGAVIEHDNHLIEIIGVGDFWQADTYEIQVLTGSKALLVNRRIQKKIAPHDLCFYLSKRPNSLRVSFVANLVEGKYQQVNMLWISKWFTLEYDLRTQSMRYFISPVRL